MRRDRRAGWHGVVLATALLGAGALPMHAQQAATGGTVSGEVVRGWKVPPLDGATAPEVTVEGPGLRVRSAVKTTLLRDQLVLVGDYTVSATFQRAAVDEAAEYGLVVGGTGAEALACVVRTEGGVALPRGPVTGDLAWTAIEPLAAPVTARPIRPPVRPPDVDHVMLRVSGPTATCLRNDQPLGTVSTPIGALDGSPGVYLAAGSDVEVSGFSVEGAGSSFGVPRR